jgi:molybdopterin-guanine dinucleotide biosynthesis protein A
MGTDKALLPHPEGGSWLERTVRLLLGLDLPVTLLSRHEAHLQLARSLASPHTLQTDRDPVAVSDSAANGPAQQADAPSRLTAVAEPEPWEGPLLALHRLMQRHPDQRLLLCPVDMPWLTPEVLRSLLQATAAEPQPIHLAHDGKRLQPLLGVYPSQAAQRADLSAAIQRGERRLQGWLTAQDCREVRLEPAALRNVNGPEAWAAAAGTGA